MSAVVEKVFSTNPKVWLGVALKPKVFRPMINSESFVKTTSFNICVYEDICECDECL